MVEESVFSLGWVTSIPNGKCPRKGFKHEIKNSNENWTKDL